MGRNSLYYWCCVFPEKATPQCYSGVVVIPRKESVLTRVALAIVVFLALLVGIASAQDRPVSTPEINTILMESTFRIHGPKKGDAGKISFGTAFLMGKRAMRGSW
jgi:hypothetical protein